MVKKTIIQNEDPALNAALLIALLSTAFLRDYELTEDGLRCFFTQKIDFLGVMIKTFLSTLYEITNRQFYFQIINDQEAILKIYSVDGLRFSYDIVSKSTVSSQGRSQL